MVLAALHRGHGARVLVAVGAGRRRLARPAVGDVVRRLDRLDRPQLRPPVGGASPGGDRSRRARRGRLAAPADVRRVVPRRDAPRRTARRARRRAGRPRRDLPADVARRRGRVARDRARRRDPGPDLLRLRRARGRAAARGERGEGRDHADTSRRGAGSRCRCSRSSRRRSRAAGSTAEVVLAPFELDAHPGDAAGARGRQRASVPPHLHVGHDRQAEGRRARAGRLPRLDRARGRVPGRRARGRRRALRHRHGLDHGPVDGRRRRRARRHDRLRRRRARLADAATHLGDRARRNA